MTNKTEKAIISNDNSNATITMSRYVYECERSYKERISKRLIIALIITILLLFATNAMWLIYNSQYDYSTSDITVGTDGEGDANYIGQDSEINNGIYQSGNENEDTPSRCERQENS